MSISEIRGKTIVAIFAHPDDEAFCTGGTLALLAKTNIVYLITATNGEAATDNFSPVKDKSLAEIRRDEVQTSARVLGIQEVFFLNLPDGQLNNMLYGTAVAKASEVIKHLDPHILITFEHHGLTGHIDHVFITRVANSLYESTETIEQIWYFCFEKHVREHLMQYYRHKNFDVYFPKGYAEDEVELVVDVSSTWEQKMQSIYAHASQKADLGAYLKSYEYSKQKEFYFVRRKGS
ncbi:MAG: PIG-L family deacetylase [Patescibacteria group bacterium]|nr:PIG-L family deacetylase [Patescibacteria group bacterium]